MKLYATDAPFFAAQPNMSTCFSAIYLSQQVVRALGEELNFSMEFRRPSDGEMWGWEQENGSWTGLMGDLQQRKADLGVADLYIMEQYFTIIDMSVSSSLSGYTICFNIPEVGKYRCR